MIKGLIYPESPVLCWLLLLRSCWRVTNHQKQPEIIRASSPRRRIQKKKFSFLFSSLLSARLNVPSITAQHKPNGFVLFVYTHREYNNRRAPMIQTFIIETSEEEGE